MTQKNGQAVLFPQVLDQTGGADEITLVLRVPENLAYFKGHFDRLPVVPGVAQIQWAVHFARQCLALESVFSHMEAVKFKELLLPGQRLELHLRSRNGGGKLDFSYRSDSAEYSSGRIYFHGDGV